MSTKSGSNRHLQGAPRYPIHLDSVPILDVVLKTPWCLTQQQWLHPGEQQWLHPGEANVWLFGFGRGWKFFKRKRGSFFSWSSWDSVGFRVNWFAAWIFGTPRKEEHRTAGICFMAYSLCFGYSFFVGVWGSLRYVSQGMWAKSLIFHTCKCVKRSLHPQTTNGWRAPKWWALEMVHSGYKYGHFWHVKFSGCILSISPP